MNEIAPKADAKTRPSLAAELTAADTLEQTTEILLRALHGDSDSSRLAHRYVKDAYIVLPRDVREDVDQSVLRLLDELCRGADWATDAALELLQLTRTLFSSRAAGQAALPFIARILSNPDEYAPAIAVAAGQAANTVGYHGSPQMWYRLYELASDLAAPTVVGALAKTDWQALLDWLDHRHGDAWVERAVINQLPAFLVTHGAERVRELATLIWASTSDAGAREILSFMKRMGVEFDPVEPATKAPRTDWSIIIRALLGGELSKHVEESGGVEAYVRTLFVGRADTAPSEFRDALNDEIIAWRDMGLASEQFTNTMLDLIRAFRPNVGAAKTLEYLERNRADLSGRVVVKILEALVTYYAKPPARGTRDRVHARYVHALRVLTFHPEAGHTALSALLTLNAIDFRDLEFASRIVTDEARQTQVVEFAVAANWNEMLLSWLLAAAVRAASPEEPAIFRSFVSNLRQHAGNDPFVWWQSVAIGTKAIPVPREVLKSFVLLRQAVLIPEAYETYRRTITEG